MTKRLFAYFGLTMLGVYTVVFYFGFVGFCAAGVLALSLVLYALIVKKPLLGRSVVILVAVTAVLSCAVFNVYDNAFKAMSEKYNRETVSVTAVVRSDGIKRYGVYNYELHAEKIDGEEKNCKVMLYSNFKLSCDYGDTIKVNARLYACEDNYKRSRRFVYAAESEGFKLDYKVIKHGDKDIAYLPQYIQNKLSDAVQNVIGGENGELCSVITFGGRDRLSGEIDAIFSRTGLSFLIVISGLHMSIIALFVMWILKPLGKQRTGQIIRCVITIAFIVLYMFVTGLTVSVVRSGIAVAAATLALTLSRRSDVYNNLGLAATVIVITNPYAVGDIGMLLSFSSVLGILYFGPKLCRRFNRFYYNQKKQYANEIERTNQPRRRLYFRLRIVLISFTNFVINGLLVSLSAVTASLPVAALTLGSVNPTTVISSVVLVPLTAAVVVFALLTALFYYVPILGFFSYVFGAVADIASGIMIAIVRFISGIRYLTLYLDRGTVWAWIAVFTALALIAIMLKRGKKGVIIAFMLSVVFLAASFGIKYFIHSNSVVMKITNTGTPSVRVSGGGIEALLYYGGEYDKIGSLERKLRSSCGDVKTLIVPDNKLKTSRYAVNILGGFDVERVMLYHSKRTLLDLEEQAMNVKDYIEFYTSDVITLNLGQGVKDTIINDGKSTWQRVESGKISVLIVPDKADAERLGERYRTADFIVCGADIKNIDLLDYHNARLITKHDLNEDFNITLK